MFHGTYIAEAEKEIAHDGDAALCHLIQRREHSPYALHVYLFQIEI